MRVRVEPNAVEITIADGTGTIVGTRRLDNPPHDCGARADAAALVASILLDDRAAAPPLDLQGLTDDGDVPETPSLEPSETAATASTSAHVSPLRVRIEVGTSGSYGWLADVALGVRFRGSWGIEGWGIGLGAELLPESIAGEGLDVLMRSLLGSVDVESPSVSADLVALTALARLQVGAIQGIGRGGWTNYDRVEPALRADVGARVELRVHSALAFTLEAGLFVTIVRPRFVAVVGEDRIPLHTPNEVGPFVTLSLTLGSPP
ncbi:MAG: hypothetical protein K1X94_11150 [Sandaracinaceae bacterium]|nr:hypothetical protein [Sandaracinaceae bacterium]